MGTTTITARHDPDGKSWAVQRSPTLSADLLAGRAARRGACMTDRGPATGPAEVDAVLAAMPEDVRTALQRVRELIAAAAPTAVETIA